MPVCQRIAVVAPEREIVKANAALRGPTIRSTAGNHDDTTLPGKIQPVQEPVDENEVTEMIDQEMLLHAIDHGPLVAAAAVACVEDQHVDGRIERPDCLCAVHDRLEIGQLERERRGLAAHAPAGFLGTLQ